MYIQVAERNGLFGEPRSVTVGIQCDNCDRRTGLPCIRRGVFQSKPQLPLDNQYCSEKCAIEHEEKILEWAKVETARRSKKLKETTQACPCCFV